MMGELGYDRSHPAVVRGLAFLKAEQEEDGSWFGRWGTNYIYGTWSALCALNAAGEDMSALCAQGRRLAGAASARTAAGARTAPPTGGSAGARVSIDRPRPPGRCSASWRPGRWTARR